MTTKFKQYTITAGPSRELLFDALRLRHEGKTVEITIEVEPENPQRRAQYFQFEAQVNMLGIEDGSGNHWFFTLESPPGLFYKCGRVEGYIDTTRRTGWLKAIIS